MSRAIVLSILSTIVLVNPLHAQLEVYTVSDSAVDCAHPAVVQGPGGDTLVAWRDAGGLIWTLIQPGPIGIPDGAANREAVSHGPGVSPRVANTWFGYLLVWIDGGRVYYRYAFNDEFIDPPHFVETDLDLSHATLDVIGVWPGAYNVAWVVFDAQTSEGAHQAMFLRLTKGGHEPLVVLAENATVWSWPQISAVPNWPEPLARVYYRRDDGSTAYRSETQWQVWSPEQPVQIEEFGNDFDAAPGPLGTQAILAIGPAPTCPCGTISATWQDADGVWQEPEELTVEHSFYNWPSSPNVRDDSNGRVHAFWMQRTANADMLPIGRSLEYWVRDGQTWVDESAQLAPYHGDGIDIEVAMDLDDRGRPAFAWAERDTVDGVPLPQRIKLARVNPLVPVPGETPPAATALNAWPNPFNPLLNLAGALPASAPAIVTVHDLAGRTLRTLVVDVVAEGRFTAQWDGRDAAGRPVPSGVYVLRAGTGSQAVHRRVVLAR
jgi:hypothetical protein